MAPTSKKKAAITIISAASSSSGELSMSVAPYSITSPRVM
jgi:hypothetical protein